MLALYLLSSLLISAAFCSIDQPLLPGNGDVTDAQEGFPGHVALRPDYTFWNVMRMLRRIFDSNLERRKGQQCVLFCCCRILRTSAGDPAELPKTFCESSDQLSEKFW